MITNNMTRKEKRESVRQELLKDAARSNLQIARAAGVSDKTVAAVRLELEGRSEIPNMDRVTDTRGRRQHRHRHRTQHAAEQVHGSKETALCGNTERMIMDIVCTEIGAIHERAGRMTEADCNKLLTLVRILNSIGHVDSGNSNEPDEMIRRLRERLEKLESCRASQPM